MSSDCFVGDKVGSRLTVGSSVVGDLDGLVVGLVVMRGAAIVSFVLGLEVDGALKGVEVGSTVVKAVIGALEVGEGVATVGIFVG